MEKEERGVYSLMELTMPDVITRQQKRAQVAYSCVSSIREELEKDLQIPNENSEKNIQKTISNYSKLARRFPVLVHTCGLALATAYVDAKEEKQGEIFLVHLKKVMNNEEKSTISEQSRMAGLQKYQYLTREATESATWLKRYCEALIIEED